jgi:diguanylate cyclase (GGDEF)-like protein/PAS domain S-box-containing protein
MLFHTIKSGHKIVVNIFSTPLVQKLRQEGNTAVIDFNQLKQKQSVIAYASIPEYHWGVAVMQPVHFSKVLIARDRQLMELLTGYGIILLLAVLTVILTKRVASTHQRAKGDALIMESEERYRALITGMTEGVVLQDPSGMVLTCNPSAERILGLTNAEMADRTADDPRWGEIHEDGSDYTEQDNPALVALRTGLTQYNKIMGLRRADNELIWISINAQPLFKQAETKPYAVAVTFNDISERKAAEEQIQLLAFYDPLTRLPNRRLLMDRLQHALASSSRSGREGALLFLDMDHFKDLNDTLGHETGDMLLQQVAQRLTACVRSHDTVARLGGDEFVVVLETLGNDSLENAAKAEAVGEHILAVLNRPYQLSTHEHICSTSIGITLFKDQEVTIEELMKQADIAMYQAKKQGRNMLRFFDPKMQAAVDAHAALENELHKALTKQQFQLYFQIQVDGGNRPLGAEVLLRWIHPARGFVSPVQFIPLAEESGLILTIGAWVLDTACAQLKAWQQNVYTCELVLSVNVSAKQFLQTDFVAQVQADVRKHGINPNLLKMELTEGMLVNDIEDIIVKMNALKKIGIQISLDDFGTGFSSLQYLKLLPLDQLKIDQSFVRDMVLNSNDYAIVKTIIDMAKNLKLTVIAEGVETEQQRELLFSNGCEHYQGYLFSKPLPLAEFEALLQRG